MLVLFFGVSCVGKTDLIGELIRNFGWKYIPTPITRPLRVGETGKIPVSKEEFSRMEKNGEFICVNEWFDHLYGTPYIAIETAVNDRRNFHVLDFPLSKRHYLRNYPHAGVIILPESEKQLIRQIEECGREKRLKEIIEDYEAYHKNLPEPDDPKTFIVINYPKKQAETACKINSLVKDCFMYSGK